MNDLRAPTASLDRSAASQTVPAASRPDPAAAEGDRARSSKFDKNLDRAFANTTNDAGPVEDEIRQPVEGLQAGDRSAAHRVNGRQANVSTPRTCPPWRNIDGFMQRYQLSTEAEQNWVQLRGDRQDSPAPTTSGGAGAIRDTRRRSRATSSATT